LLFIVRIFVFIPCAAAYPFDQFRSDPVTFYLKGIISVRHKQVVNMLQIG
jgi:hypothetical protein